MTLRRNELAKPELQGYFTYLQMQPLSLVVSICERAIADMSHTNDASKMPGLNKNSILWHIPVGIWAERQLGCVIEVSRIKKVKVSANQYIRIIAR